MDFDFDLLLPQLKKKKISYNWISSFCQHTQIIVNTNNWCSQLFEKCMEIIIKHVLVNYNMLLIIPVYWIINKKTNFEAERIECYKYFLMQSDEYFLLMKLFYFFFFLRKKYLYWLNRWVRSLLVDYWKLTNSSWLMTKEVQTSVTVGWKPWKKKKKKQIDYIFPIFCLI